MRGRPGFNSQLESFQIQFLFAFLLFGSGHSSIDGKAVQQDATVLFFFGTTQLIELA